MQAYDEGKKICCRNSDSNYINGIITKGNGEDFNWVDFDYDIVQEPIIKYVILDKSTNNTVSTYSNEKEAIKHVECYADCRIIKLVQDMDYGEEQ